MRQPRRQVRRTKIWAGHEQNGVLAEKAMACDTANSEDLSQCAFFLLKGETWQSMGENRHPKRRTGSFFAEK